MVGTDCGGNHTEKGKTSIEYYVRRGEPRGKKSGTDGVRCNLSLLDLPTFMVVFLQADLVAHLAPSFSHPLCFQGNACTGIPG